MPEAHPIDPADQGGDPACWADLVEDQRDRPDLATRTEVNDLVIEFYREILFDDLLQPVFEEVAEVDWAEHILKLIDYWCWILFGTEGYRGAVTRTHRHLHGRAAVEPEHCDRWYALWATCVDQGYAGPCADKAKRHAATLMAGLAKHVFGYPWTPPGPGASSPG